ncbi:branched-chain amino acid ABC transporter permease [Sulfoacidibacillus thermotolerans]|uniref:Amino acid ABC transporter n=1 Tax=Sulfoacidibacillus thermotolerans TaxID=1765684 RepID=A0A2U3D944_SULT2|nr:branched-chain amino acid ABC transporter permease [Sulfoacidibacillus thermotolerans]PWI57808.1 amino acid ABC transporter [Sulfoacidibacillus thermotolerans]
MRKRMLANVLIILLLFLLFAVGPSIYQNQSLIFQMMVFMALAQGVNILYGFTGYLPFGYVGFFGIGAYGAAIAVNLLHVPALVAVILGGFSALLAGLVLSPLLRLSGAYFSIGSLAASEILYNVVSNDSLQPITGGPYGVNLAGIFDEQTSYVVMLLLLVLATAFVTYLRSSRFGMSLIAIREDPVSAEMAGIHVVRTRVFVWLATAVLAGLVGATYAWHISVFYPNTVFDLSVSIFAIVFTLFGGGTTVLGPVVGTILLYGLYNAIGISSPQYFQLIYGVLIMALVLFLPNGLMSLLTRRGIYVP